jgi:very-short-patch-repair endonuclease
LAYSNTARLRALLEGALGYAEDETHNLTDFIEANLRKAIFTPPDREVDVQNAVEALLVGRNMLKGTDYDRETGLVKASGKESVPDFIFPRLKLCIEVPGGRHVVHNEYSQAVGTARIRDSIRIVVEFEVSNAYHLGDQGSAVIKFENSAVDAR